MPEAMKTCFLLSFLSFWKDNMSQSGFFFVFFFNAIHSCDKRLLRWGGGWGRRRKEERNKKAKKAEERKLQDAICWQKGGKKEEEPSESPASRPARLGKRTTIHLQWEFPLGKTSEIKFFHFCRFHVLGRIITTESNDKRPPLLPKCRENHTQTILSIWVVSMEPKHPNDTSVLQAEQAEGWVLWLEEVTGV